jgi:urease accessory protein
MAGMRIAMTIDSGQLLLLLNWMSPAFPIGGFAFSHGLEMAIASGKVSTVDDTESWIRDVITGGSGWLDAVLFAQCWRDDGGDVNAHALALAGSKERHLETVQLGRAFRIAAHTWMGGDMSEGDIAYPVAAGQACRALGIQMDMALVAFVQGFVAAQVSVAIRLVPLGQTRGLAVLKALAKDIGEVAQRAGAASLEQAFSHTLGAEVMAMKHETLQPRIFIS